MGPAHVTLKLRRGLPKLRTPRCYRVLERALRAGMEKPDFLLCQFSVQDDHLHLIVEANSQWDLTRGMQGLTIRIAKALNRHWARTSRAGVRRALLRTSADEGERVVAGVALRPLQRAEAREVVLEDAARSLLVRTLVHRLAQRLAGEAAATGSAGETVPLLPHVPG